MKVKSVLFNITLPLLRYHAGTRSRIEAKILVIPGMFLVKSGLLKLIKQRLYMFLIQALGIICICFQIQLEIPLLQSSDMRLTEFC